MNQKGGVGKSTATHNLGAFLALQGFRTLMIDVADTGNFNFTYKNAVCKIQRDHKNKTKGINPRPQSIRDAECRNKRNYQKINN